MWCSTEVVQESDFQLSPADILLVFLPPTTVVVAAANAAAAAVVVATVVILIIHAHLCLRRRAESTGA